MNKKFVKVILDILKYSVCAILGAYGITLTGCAFVPCLNF